MGTDTGNFGIGNTKGQEVISASEGSKTPNNDAYAAEKSKQVGPAEAPEKAKTEMENTPNGQRVF